MLEESFERAVESQSLLRRVRALANLALREESRVPLRAARVAPPLEALLHPRHLDAGQVNITRSARSGGRTGPRSSAARIGNLGKSSPPPSG